MQRLTAWLGARRPSGTLVQDGAAVWIEVQARAGDVYLVRPEGEVQDGAIAVARSATVNAYGHLPTRQELLVLAGFVGRYA